MDIIWDGPLPDARANAERQWLLTSARRPDWISIYKESAAAEWRKPMREALANAMPFKTVLDLGCNCGPMVPTLEAVCPGVEILGVDISPLAVATARSDWPQHHWVEASMIDWLPQMAAVGRKFDIVTSGTALSCVAVEWIDVVLKAVGTLATKAIVLQEPMATSRFAEGAVPGAAMPEWFHDYPKRLASLGWLLERLAWQDVVTNRPACVMTFRPDGGLTR